MKRTRICDLLGIEYPIIQGGMTWIANAELAAAVSEAGGLGLISPNAEMGLEDDVVQNLRSQIRKVKGLTAKPFGVNFPVQIPEMKELIKYTHPDLLINDLLPKRLWGLEVIIPGAIQDSRLFGAASASMARIWNNDSVTIAYVAPMLGLDTITLGSTLRVKIGHIGDGQTVLRYREDNRNQDVFEVSMLQTEKLVSLTCGYIISNVTSA